jgi:pyruvate formate lyase activating enzyme
LLAEREKSTLAREKPEDIKGTVFNIQRYSIQDGPGIRTTVFLKGCPLRCQWCSNPESQEPYPEIAHRDSLCTKCLKCLEVCPTHAITLGEKTIAIDRKLCNNCGKCVAACLPGALKLFGDKMSVGQVFQEVEKDMEFYRASGGGVTVSGGEPLYQPDFVAALFELCRGKSIHTCIETSGCASIKALEKVLKLTSLVLFDIKIISPTAHKKWTGLPNDSILRNLELVVKSRVPLIIRVPLIPGVNDTEDELKNIASFAASALKEPRRVDLLPYHRFGMGKYQQLDRKYKLADMVTQKEAAVQQAKQLFESYGLEVEIVG